MWDSNSWVRDWGTSFMVQRRPEARPGPNPESPPPVDPSFLRRLDDVSRRVGRPHRPHWMRENRIWGIQARGDDGQWNTVLAVYDEQTQWEGNQFPYRPLDERTIRELCEAALEIKYDTGDIDRDRALHAESEKQRLANIKDRRDVAEVERIAALVTGTDPARFERFAKHVGYHGADVGFTEFFPGADIKDGGG